MMAAPGNDNVNRALGHGPGSAADAGADFVRRVLVALAAQDRQAFEAVLRDNPHLAEEFLGRDEIVSQMRGALVESTGPDDANVDYDKVVREVRAWISDPGRGRTVPLPAEKLGERYEARGILTSVTRQLPPEKAFELYRKIAPLVVFEILKRLNRSARLEAVHKIVDHLCSEPVQQRLRQCEHVREGIIEELCRVLPEAGVRELLDKETLLEIVADSGAMGDLSAMENCIRLARTKAG